MLRIDRQEYPDGLEQYNLIDNMFNKGPLAQGAECGIDQVLSGTFKSSNARTSLATALSGVWNLQRDDETYMWIQKTGTKDPRSWSTTFNTPILCMFDDNDRAEAKQMFAIIQKNSPTEAEANKALAYLDKATFYDFITSFKLPSFMRDWVLKRFEDDDGEIDVEGATEFIREFIPKKEDWKSIVNRIVNDGEHVKFLTKISVNIDIKTQALSFALPDYGLGFKETVIPQMTWNECSTGVFRK